MVTSRILIVCTGNICRSPMAEGLLRAGAKAVGLGALVASAGLLEGGQPADPSAVDVMADRGIDISRHRSRQIATVDVQDADLVIAMAREHVVAVASMVPDAFERTFTLKEFVERATDAGPKPVHSGLGHWLDTVHDGRIHADMLRADDASDIADPLGKGRRAFERAAAEIDELIWATVDLLAGYVPQR